MTRISKTVTRETAVQHRGDALVVELEPKYLRIHPKGKRGGVNVPYDAVYELGLKLAARRRIA